MQTGCQVTEEKRCSHRHWAGRTLSPSFLPSIYQKLCSREQYLEACMQYLISQSFLLIFSTPEYGREQEETFTEPDCLPWMMLWAWSSSLVGTVRMQLVRFQWLFYEDP